MAGWQSGYAAACKAVNAGSIPASASIAKIFDCANKKGFIGANLMLGMIDPEIAGYLKDLFNTLNKNI